MLQNFFVRDLRIFVESQSVSQTRLENFDRDKHSRLVQKFVNHGQKCLITSTPGGQNSHLHLNTVNFLTLLLSRHLWQLHTVGQVMTSKLECQSLTLPIDGPAHFEKHKLLLKYQNYFLLTDTCWTKFSSTFKYS